MSEGSGRFGHCADKIRAFRTMLDVDPELLGSELDLYWVAGTLESYRGLSDLRY
jgi:hypothetical protein